jgi:hypothetical protein
MTNPALEAQIRAEIQKNLANQSANLPDRGEHYYFNNFHLNLPGKNRRVSLQGFLDDRQCSPVAGKTPREFFADVDKALQELGVNLEKLAELMTNYKELAIRKRIFELTFPAYVRLREMGYTAKDLNG